MLLRFDPFTESGRTAARGGLTLPADAYRLDDRVYIHLDLPGVEAEDFDVTVERNTVTVTVERGDGTPDGAERLIAERPAGVFTRTFFLGEGLDPDRIEADYEGGVLTLVVPLAEQAKPRKIVVGHDEPALTG